MPDIQRFIKMLQDEDHNKRYEACEELRVWRHPLPQEAIDALLNATGDSNSDVADAARRALALHTQPSKWEEAAAEETAKLEIPLTVSNAVKLGARNGAFGAFVAAIPVSILKTILFITLAWSCTMYSDFGSIELSSCGLINFPDDYLCWLYLGISLIGGALFGALSARIGLRFISDPKKLRKMIVWWGLAAGSLFDLLFVFYWLWPGQ